MSTGLTVIAAFSALMGAVFGRARLDRLAVERPVFEPVLPPLALLPAPPVAPVATVAVERIPHIAKKRLAIVTPEKAVDCLISWMNGDGLTGHFSASEIDEYWQTCCTMLDLEPLSGCYIRESMEARGLKVGQVRLNTATYFAVRQRTGKGRAVVYRIPRCRIVAGEGDETPVAPVNSRKRPGSDPVSDRYTASGGPHDRPTGLDLLDNGRLPAGRLSSYPPCAGRSRGSDSEATVKDRRMISRLLDNDYVCVLGVTACSLNALIYSSEQNLWATLLFSLSTLGYIVRIMRNLSKQREAA